MNRTRIDLSTGGGGVEVILSLTKFPPPCRGWFLTEVVRISCQFPEMETFGLSNVNTVFK